MPFSANADNRFPTSIHVLVSAILKLARRTRIPRNRKAYRGLGRMKLGSEWFCPDERGARSGVELGFMSTTLSRCAAAGPAGRRAFRALLRAPRAAARALRARACCLRAGLPLARACRCARQACRICAAVSAAAHDSPAPAGALCVAWIAGTWRWSTAG
jgi:hypothetical protein